jgi:TIGR03009 family protein
MHKLGYGLIGVLSLVAFIPAGGQPQGQETIASVLAGWEKAMTDLTSFVAVVERVSEDKALGAPADKFKGYAMFLKPTAKNDGPRARLEMAKVNNTKIIEKYICTGTYLYEYAHANSVVRVHTMPQNKQVGVQGESFLSFLFGMSAAEAQKRYDMKLVYPAGGKPDPNYHYLLVKPKLDHDKSDFAEARLSLYRKNNLPAQIWYLQPNKNQITWTFTQLQINVQIPVKYFEPDLPKDWRVERVPQKPELQGRPVIRK